MRVIVYKNNSYRITEKHFEMIDNIMDEIKDWVRAGNDDKVFYYEDLLCDLLEVITKNKKPLNHVSFIYNQE